jgi:hypothetical protein
VRIRSCFVRGLHEAAGLLEGQKKYRRVGVPQL